MKLSIVLFLGLCAVATAQWPPRDSPTIDPLKYWGPGWGHRDSPTIEPFNAVTDKIREAIEKLLKTATNSFSFVASKMKNLMDKMNEEAGLLVMKAKDKANVIKGEIQGKLNEMKEKGGEVASCAKALEPEYWKVEKDLMTDVKKCAGEVYVSSEEMKEEVSRGMAALRSAIGDLRELVGDCLGWNPINTVKCVKEKTDAFKKVYNELMASINAAYDAAKNRAKDIMSEGKQCNANALESAKERVKELNQRLTNCYKFEFYF